MYIGKVPVNYFAHNVPINKLQLYKTEVYSSATVKLEYVGEKTD